MSAMERAARWAGMADPSALQSLTSWSQERALDRIDVHLIATLAARYQESDPQVLKAAALAVRAPRHGHICVDLREIDALGLLPESAQAEGDAEARARSLALPTDREAWLARVATSPLVRTEERGDTPLVLWHGRLYSDRYFRYEMRLLHALRARFADRREVQDPALLRRGLDALFQPTPGEVDRQQLAAATALLRGALVLSGGPGTGKTYTVRNLLTLMYAQWAAGPEGLAPPRVALAAPTGKAAARMVEAVRAGLETHLERAAGALPEGASVEGLREFLLAPTPSTLHRLLGWRPDTPTRFRHDAQRPLPVDIVVVDEASMVDLALMAKLVDAVPPQARLLLLGDRHQLASVEAGSVLADLCGEGQGALRVSAPAAEALARVAGIEVQPTEPAPGPWDAVVFLTRSRRFDEDSGVGRFARQIVSGRVEEAVDSLPDWPAAGPPPLSASRPGVGEDLGRLTPGAGGLPASARACVVEGYRPYLERLRAGPRAGQSHEEHYAEVLRLMDGFRVLCAHREGPYGVQGVNERVLSWLVQEGLVAAPEPWWLGRPILITRNDYEVRRFNGDVGVVVRDAAGQFQVAFAAEGGRVSCLRPARLPSHQTVLAMTIHKSQGSEFRDVLVVLPDRPSPVLTRELIYTGITRAKERVTVLTDRGLLTRGLQRPVQRASGLSDSLWR